VTVVDFGKRSGGGGLDPHSPLLLNFYLCFSFGTKFHAFKLQRKNYKKIKNKKKENSTDQ